MTLVQKEVKAVYLGDTQVRPGKQPITVAGIYHSPDLGLISISSNGINRTTIADKNLGATTVYNSGDALSENNCGVYFQWGNNSGFNWTGSISTTSSQVNASSYGPGNYFDRGLFVIGYTDRSNTTNNNLRGDTTNTNEARRGPCNIGYHIPSSAEWNAFYNLYTTLGLSGYSNWVSYFKFPIAGYRDGYGSSGAVQEQGTSGHYWSTTGGSPDYYALIIRVINNSITTPMQDFKSNGCSIRPFKNEAVQPDNSRTVLYQ